MNIFYTPNINSERYTLDQIESRHAVKVLRLKEGDQVQLIDGIGGHFLAEISLAHPKKCELRILEKFNTNDTKNFKLHVAIAPTKSMDRLEYFIEKATEIGIDEITPLICQRSERKIVKTDRLLKVCIAAAKQSIKPHIPTINEATLFKDFINNINGNQLFIAHCEPDDDKEKLKKAYQTSENAVILIGPEGDFSPLEIELAKNNHFKAISLSDERLRTETAAIVACHSINFMNE